MLYYINDIKSGNAYRKLFLKKYREHIQTMENISEPILYKVLSIINILSPLIISITSLILFFYFHRSLRDLFVIFLVSIIAFFILNWILSNNSPFFREYKDKYLHNRLKAIDSVIEEFIETQDIICKEHYIDIFRKEYSKSFTYVINQLLQNIINMDVFLILLLLQILTFVTKSNVGIILIIISYLIEYLHRTFLLVDADCMYKYITEDYKCYLSEKYLKMQNITSNTEYPETEIKTTKRRFKNKEMFNNEKQLYKAYKKIYQEKGSYNQWIKMAKERIDTFSRDEITNLIKKIEIRIQKNANEDVSLKELTFLLIIPVLLCVVNIISSIFDHLVSFILECFDIIPTSAVDISAIFDVLNEISSVVTSKELYFVLWATIVILLYTASCLFFGEIKKQKMQRKLYYYKELNSILEKRKRELCIENVIKGQTKTGC